MANATKKLTITYDRISGDKLILNKDIEQLILNRIPSGLWLHDAGDWNILIVGTKKENHEGYTWR